MFRLDKKRISTLCSMNDERLWSTLKLFAAGGGIDLSKKRVTPRDVESVRRTLGALTDSDISRINELISVYKYGR